MSIGANKLLTLQDISYETGIPYRTLSVLFEHYGDRIPSILDGSRRRFTSDSVKAFRELWKEYKGGVKKTTSQSDAWYLQLVDRVEQAREGLANAAEVLAALRRELKAHPPKQIYFINALPASGLKLLKPIAVLVDVSGTHALATFEEADLSAEAPSAQEAVLRLREVMIRTFFRLQEESSTGSDDQQLTVLRSVLQRARSQGN